MKLQPYLHKLSITSEYKDFQKKYKDAFMVAGFFVLDFESGQNIHQLDYYVPSQKKIAAFTLDKRVTMQLLDTINSQVPEKLDAHTNIDLDALQGILQDEMKNRSITEEIKKIIAVLQNIQGKKMWTLNCVLSGMSILNAHLDDESETILRMEKKSILDYVKHMPMSAIPQNPGQAPSTENVPPEEVSARIKKLDELKAAIEKEKDALVKQAEQSTARAKGKKMKRGAKAQVSESSEESEDTE